MKVAHFISCSLMQSCFDHFGSIVIAVGLYGNDDMHNAVVRFSSYLHTIQQDIHAVNNQVWFIGFC